MAWAEVATAKTKATLINLIIASSHGGRLAEGGAYQKLGAGFCLTKAIGISLAEPERLEALDHHLNAPFKTL
jgi:hypothetical protein